MTPWLLILWIHGVPVMHDFATKAQCEQVRRYAVKHETRTIKLEGGLTVVRHGVEDSVCLGI